MKKSFIYAGAILAATISLTNCTKEINSSEAALPEGIPFEICANPTTKTTVEGLSTKWAAGDGINVFHAAAGKKEYVSDNKFTIAGDLADGRFTGALSAALGEGTYDWYAIYPYSEFITSPANTSTGYSIIGSRSDKSQSQTGVDNMSHISGQNYPLYGKSTAPTSASEMPSINMKPAFSVLKVKVTNTTGSVLEVSNISFTAPEAIVGQFYIDFSGDAAGYTDGQYVSKTASLAVTEASIAAGKSAYFYLAVKPFTAKSGSNLTLSVNGYEKELILTKDLEFTAGHIKKISFAYDYVPTLDTFTAINDISKLSDGSSILIVGKSGEKYYQLPVNPTVSSGKVAGVEVTVTDNTIMAYVTSAWKATKSGDYWQLSSGGKNIYHSSGGNSGTNLAYGTSTSYPWRITNHNTNDKTFKLAGVVHTGDVPAVKTRGMLMSGTTFGGYSLSNIDATGYSAIMLFVKEEAPSTDPAIIANDITEISARGESAGKSSYTIENPVDGRAISATCDGAVVTSVEAEAGTIRYTVSANTTTSAREGSITLTYGDVIKVVKVSQLAPVFKVSRTEVELEAAANSSSTITVTSDFDWTSEASSGAGFTSDPTTCEWTNENSYTDGKTTVTITASAANDSEEGTKTLGTLTFTNKETSEQLVVTVTQKTSYVAPVLGNIATGSLTSGRENVTLEEGKAITYSDVKKGSSYAEYTPGRFYASNEFVVSSSAGNITKITITCSDSKYVSVLKTTMTNAKLGAVSTSSNDVSIVLTTPATTVTFTNSAQWRAGTMTVEYN